MQDLIDELRSEHELIDPVVGALRTYVSRLVRDEAPLSRAGRLADASRADEPPQVRSHRRSRPPQVTNRRAAAGHEPPQVMRRRF